MFLLLCLNKTIYLNTSILFFVTLFFRITLESFHKSIFIHDHTQIFPKKKKKKTHTHEKTRPMIIFFFKY
ncbi:hypothetical protein CROQUDRAFT_600345 [Cronartium quercuum f. sp. fusiforme G11]|uniref:Uncharacterized protein n=1 Tax=Cronartium quercuum f. sp. fusiforme G11 TaxID=708437 RepID=A0A9P6TFV6_9BASI|nr:hypothetical protein CROQUDRAFT_600345 [Cronartium quercuum f. sp. fusiforme G11]